VLLGDGARLFDNADGRQAAYEPGRLKGVVKRLDGRYRPGRRAWIKIKSW